MSQFPRLGPAHHTARPWVSFGLIVIGCCGIVFAAFVIEGTPRGQEPPVALIMYPLAAVVSGVGLLVERHFKRRELNRWLEEARYHGLNFAEFPAEADLEPFLDTPLFRFGAWGRANARSHTWGRIDGRAFSVLNYRYLGRYRVGMFRKDGFVYEQTVALFPCVGLPDFHLAPADNDWTRLYPDWAELLGVGGVVRVINPLSNDPSELRARDGAGVLALFDSRRVSRRLAKLAGWTIESRNGHLAIYFHGDRREYRELAAFILKASRLVDALCRPAQETQATADEAEPSDAPATDGRIRLEGPG